jgi:hypothetical protein
MPTRDLMPVEWIDRKPKARPDMRTAAASSLGALISSFDVSNGVSNSKPWIFSSFSLYYTSVKFKAREK